MKEMKTAVLLFDLFSNYEISVALSILSQGGKKYDVFCINEYAHSEEGLTVKRSKSLEELCIDDYDSLLLPGCMNFSGIIDNEDIHNFLRQFDFSDKVIASISSSPILLLKAGLLKNKKYMAAVVKEELVEEGFTMDQMSNMRDITELKNDDGTVDTFLIDGNLLTAIGVGFIQFGIEFGKLLNLKFESRWYRNREETCI